MSPISPGTLSIVVGHHVIQLTLGGFDDRSVEVRVRLDEAEIWKSEEPGWRDLGLGLADDRLYWWSARRLVLLPKDARGDVESLDMDEDIIVAFPFSKAWVVVCETSARLSGLNGEISRLDFPDVVSEVLWRGGRLMVQIEGRPESELSIEENRLSWR